MKNGINQPERRRYHRHKIKAGAVAEFCRKRFFNFVKPQVVRSAAIVDISTHGLSFEYEGKQMWSTDFNELSISLADSSKRIAEIPFHIVSDRTVTSSEATRAMRRCGVKFNGIAPEHRLQIETMINERAAEE